MMHAVKLRVRAHCGQRAGLETLTERRHVGLHPVRVGDLRVAAIAWAVERRGMCCGVVVVVGSRTDQ